MPRGVYWPGEFLFKKNSNIDWPRVEAALDDLAKHHVNAVWLTHCSAGDAAAFARRAARRGIYVVASLSELAGEVERVRKGDHQALIDRTLASWGDAPKPIAWGLGDEPRAAYMHEMAAYVKAWKRHAPETKLTTVVMHQDVPSASTVGFDFLCADIYPYFSERNPNSFGIPPWQAWLQNVRKLRAATPRPWMMGQAFQEPWGPYEVTPQGNIAYLAGGAPHWVMPTPSQMSWQTHSAVAQGAKGVFFFLYRWPVPSKTSAEKVNLPATVNHRTDSGAPMGLVYPDGRPTPQYKATGRAFAWLARHSQRLAPLEPVAGAEVWDRGRKSRGHVVSLLAHPKTGERVLMIVAASGGSGPDGAREVCHQASV